MNIDKESHDIVPGRNSRKPENYKQRDRISVLALFLGIWALCVITIFVTSKILFPGISRGALPFWAADIERKCNDVQAQWIAEGDVFSEESFAYMLLGKDRLPAEESKLDMPLQSTALKVQTEVKEVSDQAPENAADNQSSSDTTPEQAIVVNGLPNIDLIGNACRKPFLLFNGGKMPDRHQGRFVQYVAADDRIVKKGDVLYTTDENGRHFTPALYALFAYDQYLHKMDENMRGLYNNCVIVGVILLAFGYCLFLVREHLFDSISELLLCGTCLLFHILGLLLTLLVLPKLGGGSSFNLFALMPMGLGAALSANLLGKRVGTFVALLLSVITPLLIGGTAQFQLLMQSFISSVVAIIMFQNIKKRKQYLTGGIAMAVTAIVFTAFYAYLRELSWPWESFNPFWCNIIGLSIINALVIIILVLLLTPVLEKIFGITTFVTFNENYGSDHKLLERLRNEAPGTYEHSISVARIAEDLARAIGAKEKVVECCSYFHDIGKLKDPSKFAENLQHGEENPHDKLSALESCSILRDHVTFGMELAKKAHLPVEIREAIEQHHGNGLMTGFYVKAVKQAEAEGLSRVPDKAEYSYGGRRPQRLEVVLVSIADFCEAAMRSFIQHQGVDNVSCELIRGKVEELINDKMKQNQFDHAHLTLSDLKKVIDQLVSTFCVIYHIRPTYADNKTKLHIEPDLPNGNKHETARAAEQDVSGKKDGGGEK